MIAPTVFLAAGIAMLALYAGQASGDAWSDQVLSLHNNYRAQYGARPLTWNGGLYGATLQWAQNCKFQHSDSGGRYGENLYATSGSSGSIQQAVNSWMSGSSKYNYNNPGFSPATGYFTQVVWKSTTQVACAISTCPPGTISSMASEYVVCRYTPPGNIQGQFPQNVGRRVV